MVGPACPSTQAGRVYGQTDLPCDCSETSLFTGLAEKLPRDAVWVTSNLRRTHDTAAAIIRAGLPGPQPIPGPEAIEMADLAEQNFGEWQGLTYEELEPPRAGDFHRFWHAPAHEIAPPGGESFVDVTSRVPVQSIIWSMLIPVVTLSPLPMAARSARRWRLR